MSYTVLARKYRPQSFEELVGQGHVAQTIGNAIAQGRVAHAFLFTGVRGVGKTTTARLLAKSLNCESGPTATPCNTCGPCMDITVGRDVDVQEIDGASNNSVDDVRRLQESIPFRPARDRFKIFIVDEVHMLSTGAFNAFLKTLEEPPPHVKFIFATTESHKVPITIRSRCQRYDFRLIAQGEVATRVREILGHEKITADDATVAIVAREAAGSMRDALTLLDQIVAFGGDTLVGTEVARVLGIAAHDHVRGLADALVLGDAKRALATIRDAEANGADALHFGKQVLETLRDLVVLRTTGNEADLAHWVAEERDAALALTRDIQPAELARLFSMTMRVIDDVSRSATPGMALEMGCLRVATRPQLGALEDLIAKIEMLEARLARGGGGGGSSGGASSGGGRGGYSGQAAGGRRASAADDVAERPRTHTADEHNEPSSLVDASAHAASIMQALSPRRAVPDDQPVVRPAATPERASNPEPSPEPVELAPARPSTPPPLRRAAILEWEPIVARLRETQPALAAIVEQGEARSVSAEKIVLVFQEGSFFGRQASQPQSIEAVAAAAVEFLGARPTVEVRLDAPTGSKTRTLADVERERRQADDESRRREALGHPAVLDALDVFPDARTKLDVRFDVES